MMERLNLGYSTKNIPFANQRNYKVQLVDKIEVLIRRMRWKASFFLCRSEDEEDRPCHKETYGLKSQKCPASIKEMSQFENELLQLAKDIRFRELRSHFQSRLKEDVKMIRN